MWKRSELWTFIFLRRLNISKLKPDEGHKRNIVTVETLTLFVLNFSFLSVTSVSFLMVSETSQMSGEETPVISTSTAVNVLDSS